MRCGSERCRPLVGRSTQPGNVATPSRQDEGMTSHLPVDGLLVVGDVVGHHDCPTCSRPVAQVYRPGRGRLYCTNACRQRAYRWRRAHAIRHVVERDGAAERTVNDRRHALRDERDPVAAVRDHRQRPTTVCGVFARSVRGTRTTHDRFVPEHPWSCATCAQLIAAGPSGSGVPEAVSKYFESILRFPPRPRSSSRRSR